MPRHIRLEPHLTDNELHNRYRRAHDPVERSHWLLAGSMTATAVAAVTGYSAYWIGHIARCYNADGPHAMRDRRHSTCAAQPDLPVSQLAELGAAVAGPRPEGDHWCYLVGFVHPASGRTVFHLATTVSIPLFEVELAAFAQQVGASPHKQIVLVLDRAGRHSSVQLRVPEHVHLLFLPPSSPELQPAEHLWPLTTTCLANRQFATIDELEDAQAEHCVAWQRSPELIRSTTLFRWWPKRIMKQRGPRRTTS